MDNIIDILRDDKEYYAGVGRNYLSNSDIGVLLANPKDYGKQREDNKNYAEGRYFHQLILEPHKAKDIAYVDASSRNTNIYKDYCTNNNAEFVLLKKEKENIEHLVSIIKSNIHFYDEIYKSGNLYEEPSVGVIKGMNWKGKADIVTDQMIIDLKTTSDIGKFRRSAKTYNYDSQCYIYQQLFGKPLVFFAIDKESGQLGIFRPTESFIKSGEDKVQKAIDIYNKYFSSEHTEDIVNYYINDTLE